MIQEYIKLLESFKKNQLSKFIEKVNAKAFEIINSEYANPHVAPYFKKINTTGVPFTHFEQEPDNITQIKKLINALYYARLTFKDLEEIDINDISKKFADVKLLLSNTIETAYEASYLAIHLDIDLQEMFKEEFEFILSHLAPIKKFAEEQKEKTNNVIREFPFSYKAGEVSGIAADQMRPLGGEVDYNFLTQFSAVLPSYIEDLTKIIQKYSSEIKEREPKLNQEKLDELKSAALHLLNDIEKLQGNNLFISLKFLNYIHIIRNLIILSMTTLEQIGELSDYSQDLVRDKLAQLKYEILPTLFGLIDKVEVNCMLKPGTLSAPLMKEVKKLYQALTYLPQKAIDFHAKGEELLTIEDTRFIDLRLELAYERIDTANKMLFKAQLAEDALNGFYAELQSKAEYKTLCLHQLPPAVKEKLTQHYKVFRPYLAKLDPDIDEQIVSGLLTTGTWTSYLKPSLRWVTRQLPPDHLSFILAKQSELQAFITKKKNSQLFHIQLNKDIIDAAHQQTDPVLYAYPVTTSTYKINEIVPLETNPKEKRTLNKKQFSGLANDFKEFRQLIASQIKPEDKVLNLRLSDQRSPSQKTLSQQERFADLFKRLQPYFTYLLRPESIATHEKFVHYLKNYVAKKNIEEKDKLNVQLVTQLLQEEEIYFRSIKWPEDAVYYYDIEKRYFLKLKKSGSDLLMENTEQLNAEQALDLSQWYKNKYNKLQIANQAYADFLNILAKSAKETNLDEVTQAHCRRLYSIIQPYIVDGAPSGYRKQLLKFDKRITSVLSKTITPKDIPPILQSFNDYYQKLFLSTSNEWYQQYEKYQQVAKQKFAAENEKIKLDLETQTNERAHYLLKNTEISKGINEYKTALEKFIALFSHSMQEQLQPQASGIPYPEMEKMESCLVQCTQVRAIKDIYNCLYHVEKIIIELETLTNENLQGPYTGAIEEAWAKKGKFQFVYRLLQAYGHVNEILKLGQRLAGDPHCKFIAHELIDKAQNIYALFQEHTSAYQVAAASVPAKGTVHYNPLWYVLNAFYISPKHIRALTNTNYLTTEELNQLYQHAKKATLTIEGLINSSDSYFKLFLQTPNMLILYQEMTQKLTEFTTTIHDTVLDNLDKIRSTLFTPMLLEADLWENKLGLMPGSLSEPLRRITDEYYKGLLHPLNLHSKQHIELFCDIRPLEERIEQVTQSIEKTKKDITKIENYYSDIEQLHKTMQASKPGFVKAFIQNANPNKDAIRTSYKKILPKLARLRLEKKIHIERSSDESDHFFDALCNQGLKEYQPHFTEIEAWVAASYHYIQGLKASQQMCLHTAEEKLEYLKQLIAVQAEESVQFIESYTTEAFEKHLEFYCNRHIGLQYTDTEYNQELRAYLLTFKASIIAKSKNADDINQCIQDLLKEKISIFESKHYEEYYHLDSVEVALAQFKIYFKETIENKHSLFENDETLNDKSKLINIIHAIATNRDVKTNELLPPEKCLSVAERFKQITMQVKDPNFKTHILAHKHVDIFSLTYLKMCLFDLLKAIHLYEPTRKKLFNVINDAVSNPPKIDALVERFGLFTKPIPHGSITVKPVPVAPAV